MPGVIAVLEDNEGRIAAMQAALGAAMPGADSRCFRTAPGLLAWLKGASADVRLLSLDHDLDPDLQGGDPGTGRDVADYLSALTPSFPVVIHTANAVAASGMKFELESAGWLCERVVPCDDLEWVGDSWMPAVQRLIGLGARRG